MKIAAAAAIAMVAGCIAGSAAVFALRAPPATKATVEPVWSDAKWPFPQDQWDPGRAFVCMPADCGTKIEVFLRPKSGFCNCSTGVADDAELARVADTELVSREVVPLGPSRQITVGWMHGLSRAYRSADDNRPSERLLSVGFNDECDAVVALVRFGNGDPAVIEPAVLALLNTRPVVLWVKKEMGLEFVKRDW